MDASDLPPRFPQAFAYMAGGAFIRPIPLPAQTPTLTDAPASLTEGFPPITADPISSGGIPPNIEDFNGILYQLSLDMRWIQSGGYAQYDATFATAIGGYEAGALLKSTADNSYWMSTADDNMTDPDGGSPANWSKVLINPDVTAGSIRLGGGIVVQWGRTMQTSTGEPVVSTTFPIPMANAAYGMALTPIINAPSTAADTWIQSVLSSKTATGLAAQYQRGAGATNPNLDGYEWIIIGLAA